jgi:hypothetical protein
MFGKLSFVVALTALSSLPLATTANAGVADYAGAALASSERAAPIEKAQYSVSGNGQYCWYGNGWRGPGWYVCGDEWDNGLGWGGGHRDWRHGWRGVGTWRPGPAASSPRVIAPSHNFGVVAPSSGFGGAPAFHGFGGGAGSHEFSGFHGGGFGGFGGSHGVGGGVFNGGGGHGHGR